MATIYTDNKQKKVFKFSQRCYIKMAEITGEKQGFKPRCDDGRFLYRLQWHCLNFKEYNSVTQAQHYCHVMTLETQRY